MHTVWLDGESLCPSTVVEIGEHWREPAPVTVAIDPVAAQRMHASRAVIEQMVESHRIVYGVTTGFGALKDRIIPEHAVKGLQRNLLLSHAAGVGPALPEPVVRAMMVIRANALAKGFSGIRLIVVERLLDLLNRGIHPIVPEQGSVGASGDPAPLAHIALALIGQGEVTYQDERMPAEKALQRCKLDTLELQAKEGVALINGTALMAALGCVAVERARSLLLTANAVAALSLEALGGTAAAFDRRLHAVRPHAGQVACAQTLRLLLDGSTWVRTSDQSNVQDAYTLRCIPQVHGAVSGVVEHVHSILQTEINSATDNPLVFADDAGGTVLSGGNFHGEPLALAMDYLGLAVTDLGNMAERRIARLLDSSSNGGVLPPFLADQGGVNSGFMLLQYTAAALASENKVLAHPASADTIPTSANVEDHVSMGPIGARKALRIIEHVETIVAIELLCAAQGLDLRRRDRPSLHNGRGTGAAYRCLRARVPALWADELMYPHMEASRRLVQDGDIARAVAAAIPELIVGQNWPPTER